MSWHLLLVLSGLFGIGVALFSYGFRHLYFPTLSMGKLQWVAFIVGQLILFAVAFGLIPVLRSLS